MEILDTSRENFLAFLEYLYTDHSLIEDSDAVGIMCLADLVNSTLMINILLLFDWTIKSRRNWVRLI